MSDRNSFPSQEEAWLRQQLQDAQADAGERPSAAHDAAILQAAGAASTEMRSEARQPSRSRQSWKGGWFPVALAASLVLGVLIGRQSWMIRDPRTHSVSLTIPSQAMVRGEGAAAASNALPVEQADPALWYRYIQELVFSGQVELAEAHLRRFRELHPDFVYQP